MASNEEQQYVSEKSSRVTVLAEPMLGGEKEQHRRGHAGGVDGGWVLGKLYDVDRANTWVWYRLGARRWRRRGRIWVISYTALFTGHYRRTKSCETVDPH